jgi:hypothetical protein
MARRSSTRSSYSAASGSGGWSESPYPRQSGATARYPAAATASIWWRHEYHISGNPCRNTTVPSSPATTSSRTIVHPTIAGGGEARAQATQIEAAKPLPACATWRVSPRTGRWTCSICCCCSAVAMASGRLELPPRRRSSDCRGDVVTVRV